MGSKKYDKRQEELYKKAASLASDGRFSKSDYESLDSAYGKIKGWQVGSKKSNLTRHIARALSENNAALDSDAQELANKYNKSIFGGYELKQTKDSSGNLRTSFKQSEGGAGSRMHGMRLLRGKEGEFYEGEFANAPISNIEKKAWTQHTPSGSSTSKWDVYTRTYAHSPKPVEPVKEEAPAPAPPVTEPGKDLTDARSRWDQSGGQGSIGYDPASGRAPGVVDGVGAAADYGNRATDDYHKRFIPHLNAQANLEALEMGYSGGGNLDRFKGKVPELASGDIKDLYDYYSKKITA